jgi:hypothetical protein
MKQELQPSIVISIVLVFKLDVQDELLPHLVHRRQGVD